MIFEKREMMRFFDSKGKTTEDWILHMRKFRKLIITKY